MDRHGMRQIWKLNTEVIKKFCTFFLISEIWSWENIQYGFDIVTILELFIENMYNLYEEKKSFKQIKRLNWTNFHVLNLQILSVEWV